MTRRLRIMLWGSIAVAALGLTASGVAWGLADPAPGATITVRMMSAKLMKQPKFVGPVSGSVSRGDQLKVEEVQRDWFRVSAQGREGGWIHRSSVVDAKVKLSMKPGTTGGNVS